jgi:hypothetical protein
MARSLRAINYFGSKVANAHRYPAPRYRTIIEPFAGGAGYSLLHHTHDVILIDLNVDVIGAWQYLIAASREEIMALPLIEPGQDVAELDTTPGGRLLISWCLNQSAAPRRQLSPWGACVRHIKASFWGERRRAQAAEVASRVKHWTAFVGDYRDLPDARATWFIDPPYVDGGANYAHSAIDYTHLAGWACARAGQVIVCERAGADWMPFAPLYDAPSARDRKNGSRCAEAVWLGGDK